VLAPQHLLDRHVAPELAVARTGDAAQTTAAVLAEVLVPTAIAKLERLELAVDVGR